MTWGDGAVPLATADMYKLLGETLKAGALAACMPGGRSTAAIRMGTRVRTSLHTRDLDKLRDANRRRPNFGGTESRDKEVINSFERPRGARAPLNRSV
jgi:hypothetical protein